MRKKLFILVVLATAYLSIYAQTNNESVNWDSTIFIKQSQFEAITVKATSLLKNKKVFKLTNLEHAEIIRIYNTTLKADSKVLEKLLFPKFINVFYESNYETEVLKLYPDILLNRKKGNYFTKLGVELGGYLHLRSYYIIKG